MESVRIVDSLAGIDPAEWNALAGEQPFIRHEFLSALIETGCASGRTGWLPQILVLRRAGAMVGAMPLFVKSHSYGEYVFDWSWADAHERNGIDYYPKLLCAVPFTPVRGSRLLARSDAERHALIASALEIAKDASSLHVLFPRAEEARLLEQHGMLLRRTVQFHWRNDAYADFEAFLARLSHARRKNIRQERRKLREAGVSFRWLEGRAIASALFLSDSSTLYGRYWGAVEQLPLLHFECCYYQAIEYAIARGLQVFEGGAQGEHKLFRGLLPTEAFSAHWLAHPKFARAVESFLESEAAGITRYVNELCDHSPFKDMPGG